MRSSECWGARIRTWEWQNQNLLTYHLSTPHLKTNSKFENRNSKLNCLPAKCASLRLGETPSTPDLSPQHFQKSQKQKPPNRSSNSFWLPAFLKSSLFHQFAGTLEEQPFQNHFLKSPECLLSP